MDELGIPSPSDIQAIGKGLGEAANGGAAFIDKLDQATGGWWVVHKAKKQMEAARQKMMLSRSALKEIGIEPTEQMVKGIAFSALQEVKGFENLTAVIERMSIPDDAPAGKIEDEWMNRFVECSKEAFSEWKRSFLADAAGAKAADPNSLSIGALNCIARMEAQDMKALEKLRSITPDFGLSITCPVVLFKDDSLLSMVDLDIMCIERLRDIGVLREVENRIRFDACTREPQENFYDGKPYIICIHDDTGEYITMRFGNDDVRYPATRVSKRTPFSRTLDYFFDFGIYSYTTGGHELIKLIPFRRSEKLKEYLEESQKALTTYESRANKFSIFEQRDFERAIKGIVKNMDRRSL